MKLLELQGISHRFGSTLALDGAGLVRLGHVAIEILELMGHVVDYRSGRLDPAITYLMRKLRRSRDAVVRALAALRMHGFLDWLRRFERVEREGPGPRVRQVSNAYKMRLPACAERLLPATDKSVGGDDAFSQHLEERQQEVAAMKAVLGLEELAVIEVDDGPLGRALAQMADIFGDRAHLQGVDRLSLADEVWLARSSRSTSSTFSPSSDASRAIAQPLMPPPTMRRS